MNTHSSQLRKYLPITQNLVQASPDFLTLRQFSKSLSNIPGFGSGIKVPKVYYNVKGFERDWFARGIEDLEPFQKNLDNVVRADLKPATILLFVVIVRAAACSEWLGPEDGTASR
ncbi:hypothetical protein H1R20_g4656, partial [Candolleomyces eurysporus]